LDVLTVAKLHAVSSVELAGTTKEVRRFGLVDPTLLIRVATRHAMTSQERWILPIAKICRGRSVAPVGSNADVT
jgi:hypothetical protein